ncbi:MAG: BatA and WFA domain-containing protein [Candidatus Aureabacteria bacterium]|nr:BatA and WFA domain-containing protein [Candidatus Auribacterota bacterium]
MISFTYPVIALFSLITIPALFAVYLFRSKFQKVYVSSLMLWQNQKKTSKGGSKLRKIKTPLIFFIELLIFICIVLAVSRPLFRIRKQVKPLIIILDDSVSMQAIKDNMTSQHLAIQAILNEIDKDSYAARFILAGKEPQVLGPMTTKKQKIKQYLSSWKCNSPTSNIGKAIALAHELGKKNELKLIITDHLPEQTLKNSDLQWWAFGTKQSNIGFTAAKRFRTGTKDKYFFEISNFSDKDINTYIYIQKDPSSKPQKRQLKIKSNQKKHLTLESPVNQNIFHTWLEKDSFLVDNEIFLVPEELKKLCILNDIKHPKLRESVKRAVKAAKSDLTNNKDLYDIVFTDKIIGHTKSPSSWVVRFLSGNKTKGYIGPFVTDTSHPLTEGLLMESVIWGASNKTITSGLPVITAGNILLLIDVHSYGKRREFILNLDFDKSTLQNSINWPILIWNMLDLRKKHLPGFLNNNVNLATDVTFKLPKSIKEVKITEPVGSISTIKTNDADFNFNTKYTGIYKISYNDKTFLLASNFLSNMESDLRGLETNRLGNWSDAKIIKQDYIDLTWLFILISLGLLSVHILLLSSKKRDRS